MRNITMTFHMTNGDMHIMTYRIDIDDIDDLDSAISGLCGSKFIHNITIEHGVTKALVINMAQVSHMDIVVHDVEDA